MASSVKPPILRDSFVPKTKNTEQSALLDIQAVLQINAQFAADAIECVFGEALLEPPVGVYRAGKLEPVIRSGQTYYYKDGTTTVDVLNLNTVDKALYDEQGQMVASAMFMRDKAKLMSNTPFYPYRGLHMLRDLVDLRVQSHAAYRKGNGRTDQDVILKHLKPGASINDDMLLVIRNCGREILDQVQEFLGKRVWYLFFTQLHNDMLRVERGIDWRAYEWELRHGDEYRDGKYR